MSHLGNDASIRRVLVAEFQLQINECQLVGTHLKLVIGPQNSTHPEHTKTPCIIRDAPDSNFYYPAGTG